MNLYIPFNPTIGKSKPNTLIKKDISCPFCDFNDVNEIIEERKHMMWIMNRYRTFEKAEQTLILETDKCDQDLSNYSKEHLYELIDFALSCWFKALENPQFKSTVLIKNHGLFSGSSIQHAHMQIVSFEEIDYIEQLNDFMFTGIEIARKDKVFCNLSTEPKTEFYEFNIVMQDRTQYKTFADYLQMIIQYVVNHLNRRDKSYNLAFYLYKGQIICKVFPRYLTTVFQLGYNFQLRPINFEELVQDIKEKQAE